ncbi:MAG: hypothetical protein JWQ29_3027 [Phenylobacterium sp.]|nr:hypothetical protein [Phenylobacterium sp.]
MNNAAPASAKPTDADLVIETLYRVAVDPVAWEQLVDVLDPDGLGSGRPPAAALGRVQEIARLARRPGEGPSADAPRAEVGWVVLSARGKVLSCNGPAVAMMAAGLGEAVVGQKLKFRDPGNAEAADRVLAQARTGSDPVIVRLERPGQDGPCFAYAAPVSALPMMLDETPQIPTDEPAAAALVFPAPDMASRLWRSVRESFGLTEAEVRLARKLREGRSLQEAAQELGVAVNTVRNQLRAVFDKMGLQRQSELVRALTELGAVAGALDPARSASPATSGDAPQVRHIILGDGRRLAYRDYGDPQGRPFLSFHEGLGSSLMPPETHGRARALGLRIIAPERPGFGQSDPRPDYSFDTVAEDVVELCDRLGLQEVGVGAVASGGPSALQTALRLGSRARFVFLCSGRPPRTTANEGQTRNLHTLFRARVEANPWIGEAIFAIVRFRRSHALTRQMVRRTAAHSPGDWAYLDAHPEVVDYFWSSSGEALSRSGKGPADEFRAFRQDDNLTPAALTVPVVVWHGAEDVLAPLPDLLAYLGDRASEVRVIDGIGHLMALKHWDEVLQRMAGEAPA